MTTHIKITPLGALVAVVRRYVIEQRHADGGCAEWPCLLCEALARIDSGDRA